jgi:hypothetical protein
MAQLMNDEQRLAALASYNPQDKLISVGKNKDNSPVLYYPAAWRLYELRLRHPHFVLESEIIHMDTEKGIVIIKAVGYDGLDYASSQLKGTAMKQGKLAELDKVETKAKSRIARDIGIGTEYALDMDDSDETNGVHSSVKSAPQTRPQPRGTPQPAESGNDKPALKSVPQSPIRALYNAGSQKGLWASSSQFYELASKMLDMEVTTQNASHLDEKLLARLEQAIKEATAKQSA